MCRQFETVPRRQRTAVRCPKTRLVLDVQLLLPNVDRSLPVVKNLLQLTGLLAAAGVDTVKTFGIVAREIVILEVLVPADVEPADLLGFKIISWKLNKIRVNFWIFKKLL